MTDDNLQEIEALAMAAKERADRATDGTSEVTPGWNNGGCPSAYWRVPGRNDDCRVEMLVEDAEFYANARADVPVLADAVLAMAEEIRRLRGEREGDQ